MSLINQMLKDLEKRTQVTPKSDVVLVGLQSVIAPSLQNDKKYYAITAIALTVALLVAIPVVIHKHHIALNLATAQPAQQIATPAAAAPAPINDSAKAVQQTTAMLTGAALQVAPNMTQLRLMLNQNILYKIESSQDEQEITLVLDNTHLVATLPAVNFSGSAIQNLTTTNEPNGDLKIVINLNPGAHLDNLDLTDTKQPPELLINIAYPSAATVAATPAPQQVALNSNDPDVQILNLKRPVQESNSLQQYQHALNLSAEGSMVQAQQVLRDLIEQYPDFIPARETLVGQLVQEGKMDDAEKLLDAGLKLDPNQVNFIQIKARLLVTQGKIESALNLLQSAPPAIEANPDYHAFIAALYQQRGEPLVAAQIYEKLLRLQPNNSKWWVGLGIALENIGKHNQALEAYNRAESSGQLTPELRAYIRTRMDNSNTA